MKTSTMQKHTPRKCFWNLGKSVEMPTNGLYLFLFIALGFAFLQWFLSVLEARVGGKPESVSSGQQAVLGPPSNVHVHSLYPHSYRILINEPEKCTGQPPFLLVLVSSAPIEHEARAAIRSTWGRPFLSQGVPILTLFLLGISPLPKVAAAVLAESHEHHDILQEDFVDTYRNLTIKTIMGLKWAASFCPGVRYIMKTDGDVFVHIENLVSGALLAEGSASTFFYTGQVINGQPIRDPRSKWYMPRSVYPRSRYPPFCSGTGYVISGELANAMYRSSLRTAILPLEDVFVGVCAHKLGVLPTHNGGFNRRRLAGRTCDFHRVVTLHQVPPTTMRRLWKDIHNNSTINC
uniref:beta-1,3-galactosyltransferase 1-like n=1 Tax=Myxine glutinosa TaxID=7769 RepID=UPI00358EB30B